jgi:hypothetical protein
MAADHASDQPAVKLAQRLLHHPHPQGPTSVEMLIERLPDGISPELPLPSGAPLIGSLVRWRHGRLLSLEAVLDAPAAPPALLAAYEPELNERGWTRFEGFSPMRGGFVSSEQEDGRVYRHGADGPVLMVGATAADGQPVDMRLRLDFEFAKRMPRGPRGLPPGGDLMPQLRAPAGVAMTGQSGSGSDGRWTSETTVQTGQPVAALEAHFAAQLAESGWTRVAGAAEEVIASSAWQVPDQDGEDWRGLLLVLAPFGPTERSLTLRLDKKDEPDGEDTYGNSFSITG